MGQWLWKTRTSRSACGECLRPGPPGMALALDDAEVGRFFSSIWDRLRSPVETDSAPTARGAGPRWKRGCKSRHLPQVIWPGNHFGDHGNLEHGPLRGLTPPNDSPFTDSDTALLSTPIRLRSRPSLYSRTETRCPHWSTPTPPSASIDSGSISDSASCDSSFGS